MAPDGPSADAPTRHDGKPALRRRPAGPLVAVRRRDRRARRRVGVAATRGPALMALWERLVLLAAADTFRPGAAEQLQIWADRLAVRCITGMKDPAAVAFDAIVAARARGIDTVLVDTAGRLHTEERLLEELKKVVRVVAKQQPGAPT